MARCKIAVENAPVVQAVQAVDLVDPFLYIIGSDQLKVVAFFAGGLGTANSQKSPSLRPNR